MPSVFLALFQLDHRIAFVLLCLLLSAAGVPLGAAWAHVIPPEVSEERESGRPLDRWAVVLLCLMTVSFAIQVPGFPLGALRSALLSRLPSAWNEALALTGGAVFILIPGVAAGYAALAVRLRRSPLRWPLLWGGLLVTLVWLAVPYLSTRWLKS